MAEPPAKKQPPMLVVGLKDVATTMGLSMKSVKVLVNAGALPVARRPSDKALIASREELAQWARLNMPKAAIVPKDKRTPDWPLGFGLDEAPAKAKRKGKRQ